MIFMLLFVNLSDITLLSRITIVIDYNRFNYA